jgi:hypothetical protein
MATLSFCEPRTKSLKSLWPSNLIIRLATALISEQFRRAGVFVPLTGLYFEIPLMLQPLSHFNRFPTG